MNKRTIPEGGESVDPPSPAAWRWLPMVLVMTTIFLFSHQPGGALHLTDYKGSDKVIHAIAYGALAAACLYAVTPYRWAGNRQLISIGATLFCLLYGISDEFHQSFIPNRDASLGDIAADLCGATLTVIIRQYKLSRTTSP